MTRVIRKPRSDLGESWDTVGDGGDSIAEDSASSDSQDEYLQSPGSHLNRLGRDYRTTASPGKRRVARSTAGSQHSVAAATTPTSARRRTTRASSRMSSVEPEFIMPSLYEDAVATSPLRRIRIDAQLSKRPPRSSADADFPVQARQQTLSSSRRSKSLSPESEPSTEGSASHLHLLWSSLVYPVLSFCLSVLGSALSYLRPVLGILMAIWLTRLFMGHYLSSFGPVSHLLSHVPSLPTLSSLPSPCSLLGSHYLPFCPSSPDLDQPASPLEFDQLITVQSAFEDVLSASIAGATLPLDMKRSEASIRDLKHVVRYSALPSRNELVFEFTGFIETARQASADLTRFNSRIGRAVDHILSTNRWTLQILDGVAEAEASKGVLGRMVEGSRMLAVFRSHRLTEEVLLEQYLKHTRAVEEQIKALILEAQALLGILTNLDDRLDVIASIVARDGVAVQGSRDELFAELWTRIGGNRASVKKVNEQLRLLREVAVYRKTAWAHVSGTVLKLQSIASQLEDLRERVGEAELGALEIPLRQHIENIQLGVERLERQRDESRRVESESYRRVLDRNNVLGEERLVEGNVRSVEARIG